MTKAEVVSNISNKLGIEKNIALEVVETFMEEVKESISKGQNVYLRGFGSFVVKTRAEKIGRNITKNQSVVIPSHNIPAFKPAKIFTEKVKSQVKVN